MLVAATPKTALLGASALVSISDSGSATSATKRHRHHTVEYPGCRIVKLTSLDNEMGLALAEVLRDNTSLQTFSLAPQ